MSGRAPKPESATPGPDRRIEMVIDINASPEAVWAALTDAASLERWFGLRADVRPGVGGQIRVAWGEAGGFNSKVEVWDPARHLRTTEPTTGGSGEPRLICTDWYIAARACGGTVLRMVQSGFGRGSGWDDTFDSYTGGWAYELRSMRHVLEHHAGKRRHVAAMSFNLPTGVAGADAASRVMGPEWLGEDGTVDGLWEGASYRLETVDGEVLEGTVIVPRAPGRFAGTVDSLDGGLWRVEVDRTPRGERLWLWFAAWGDGQQEAVKRWGERMAERTSTFGWGAPATRVLEVSR